MTLPLSVAQPALRAAVLAAVEMYVAEEVSAVTPQLGARRWRAAFRRALEQPNLWRTLAWTPMRFAKAAQR